MIQGQSERRGFDRFASFAFEAGHRSALDLQLGSPRKGKGMVRGLIRARASHACSARTGRAANIRSSRFLHLLTLSLLIGVLTAPVAQASPAPMLRVQGETLKWTTAGTHNEYTLLTDVPGRRTFSTVLGRTVTPPAVPGATAGYRVKAADGESGWSSEVSITYPGAEEEPPQEEEAPTEEGSKGEEPSEQTVGRPKYRLDAAPYFAPFGIAQYAPWVKAHISVIKAYPPFSDPYVALFGLPVIGYHDPATEGQAPLGRTGIAEYVAEVSRDMSLGYAGVFVDDANWSAAFPPSPGPPAALASLLVAIRAAEPGALIEMNSQYHDIWPLMKSHDPNVERALGVVNLVTKEFGVGPTAGITTAQDYGELFQFIDDLHSRGIHVVMTGDPNSNNVATMEYNLATYLLANDGGDFVNGEKQTPGRWWPGFAVNLGKAISQRERSPTGVWRRVFAGGVVYTVEPGAARQTIKLGERMHSAQWGTVESLTLDAGQGAVLVG